MDHPCDFRVARFFCDAFTEWESEILHRLYWLFYTWIWWHQRCQSGDALQESWWPSTTRWGVAVSRWAGKGMSLKCTRNTSMHSKLLKTASKTKCYGPVVSWELSQSLEVSKCYWGEPSMEDAQVEHAHPFKHVQVRCNWIWNDTKSRTVRCNSLSQKVF